MGEMRFAKFNVKLKSISEVKYLKYAKPDEYKSRYGQEWVMFSFRLRTKYRKCQWCEKRFRNLSSLSGHHIGCVHYNIGHLLDERIVIVVCNGCHKILEPWSKINLTQMLPQLYE